MNKRKRILVCDDSLTIRKLLEMVLKPAGFEVVCANSGQEAIATARREAPDLLILDFILPDMKGRDVCDALAVHPRTATVPVLIVSGKSDELGPVFRDVRSVVGFVHKPFQGDVVLEQVRRSLGGGAPAAATTDAVVAPRPASKAPPPARSDFERKEAIARALFAALRDQFARIPDLMPQLADQSPGMFFAKKFLTPAVVDTLIAAVQQNLGAPPAPPVASDAAQLASLAQDAALLLANSSPTRGGGFSARLQQLDLPPAARSVLTLVDGRNTLAQVIERSNLPPAEVLRVVAAQVRHGLIAMPRPAEAAHGSVRGDTTPVVAVVSTDTPGLSQPLAEHLARRPVPLDLVSFAENDVVQIADRIAARRPVLVLVDAENCAVEPDRLVEELRRRRELQDTRLGLITTGSAPTSAFHDSADFRTLQRPISLHEIEDLIAPHTSDLFAN